MQHLLTTLMIIMTTTIGNTQDGVATTVKKTFSRETSVNININADQKTE